MRNLTYSTAVTVILMLTLYYTTLGIVSYNFPCDVVRTLGQIFTCNHAGIIICTLFLSVISYCSLKSAIFEPVTS